MITNTHSVGVRERTAVIQWRVAHGQPDHRTGGRYLSSRKLGGLAQRHQRLHVKPEHAFHAFDSATGPPVKRANVGSGLTGMICNESRAQSARLAQNRI